MNFLEKLAFTLTPGNTGIQNPGADNILIGVLSIVYYAAGVAAVIVIVIAGIMYATADGDSSKVQSAKNTILYALVGLVAVMMAFVITSFVASSVTG